MMFLEEIKNMPEVIDNTHESCFKSYHILQKVTQMLARGDSKETIIEVANHLQDSRRLQEIYTENKK